LSSEGKGVSTLQKPDKVYLENTNLTYAFKSNPRWREIVSRASFGTKEKKMPGL